MANKDGENKGSLDTHYISLNYCLVAGNLALWKMEQADSGS